MTQLPENQDEEMRGTGDEGRRAQYPIASSSRRLIPSSRGSSPGYDWLLVCRRLPARLMIVVVRLYQFFLSPIFGGHCRFRPTCSEYFIGAVEKYGAVRGSLKGIWRILRCHPFHPGGYDPP